MSDWKVAPTLDMRGRLRFDVKGAVAEGQFADEIAAGGALGKLIRQAELRKTSRIAETAQIAKPLKYWWAVMDSNHRPAD